MNAVRRRDAEARGGSSASDIGSCNSAAAYRANNSITNRLRLARKVRPSRPLCGHVDKKAVRSVCSASLRVSGSLIDLLSSWSRRSRPATPTS